MSKVRAICLSVWLCLLFFAFCRVESGRILMLPAAIVPSHKLLFNRLAEELLAKGHEVVSWQVGLKPDSFAVPEGLDHRVLTIDVPEKYIRNMFLYENATVFNVVWEDSVTEPSRKAANWAMMRRVCEILLETRRSDFDKLLKERFDVVVLDDLYNPCGLLYVGLTRTPFIYWSHTHMRTETAWSTHSPSMPSYVPVPGTAYTDEMNFWQRTFNLLSYIKTVYIHQRIILKPTDWLFKTHFPDADVPETFYIERNASINFINTMPYFDFPRPFMPRVVFVGCLHCEKAKEIRDPSLAAFVDGASDEHGFILFTSGFTIQWKRAPARIIESFTEAFREFPNTRFVWQYNGPPIKNLPKNVFLSEWVEQQELLGHKKIKAFITHGGLNSVQEAVWHGVPIVGIPLYTDHMDYLLRATARGTGFTIDKTTVSKDVLHGAIGKILKTSTYRNEARDLKELVRDVPYSELEHAAFWVEYLIRHGEVPFSRSGADDLNIFQYFLIDVFAFIFGALVLLLVGIWYLLKFGVRLVRFILRKIGLLASPSHKSAVPVRGVPKKGKTE